jgi:SpoIIAA-like
MLRELKNTPNTMVGFLATAEVTQGEFDKIVLPAVSEFVQRTERLNYLFVLCAPIRHVAIGTLMNEALEKLNTHDKWNRVAVVTDASEIVWVTEAFKETVPGEFKVFTYDKLVQAIDWAGEQDGTYNRQVFQSPADGTD